MSKRHKKIQHILRLGAVVILALWATMFFSRRGSDSHALDKPQSRAEIKHMGDLAP